MSGKGVYIYGNGDRYEGEFKDGVFHGEGTYFFADGTVQSGKFEDGKPASTTLTKPAKRSGTLIKSNPGQLECPLEQ